MLILKNLTDWVLLYFLYWSFQIMVLWRYTSSHTILVFLFILDNEFLFVCMSAGSALTQEEIRPFKMWGNKAYLSCSRHKKDNVTPSASKHMSLLLEQLACERKRRRNKSLIAIFLQMDSEHVFVSEVKRREWLETWWGEDERIERMEGERERTGGFCVLSLKAFPVLSSLCWEEYNP